jgi:cytochrome c
MYHIGKLLAAFVGAAALSMSFHAAAAEEAAPLKEAGAEKAEAPLDEDAAEAVARREDCFKCHAIEKKKDGPPFKKIASKYKTKPDAEKLLAEHLKSGPWVTLPNGDEEEHRVIKSKDEKELANLVRWILSR